MFASLFVSRWREWNVGIEHLVEQLLEQVHERVAFLSDVLYRLYVEFQRGDFLLALGMLDEEQGGAHRLLSAVVGGRLAHDERVEECLQVIVAVA